MGRYLFHIQDTVETGFKVAFCPRGIWLYMRIYPIFALNLIFRGNIGTLIWRLYNRFNFISGDFITDFYCIMFILLTNIKVALQSLPWESPLTSAFQSQTICKIVIVKDGAVSVMQRLCAHMRFKFVTLKPCNYSGQGAALGSGQTRLSAPSSAAWACLEQA